MKKLILLDKKYDVLPVLQSPHVETIFSSMFRPALPIKFQRQLVKLEDGGLLALDWALPMSQENRYQEQFTVVEEHEINHIKDEPIIILLAGVGGGSHSAIMQQTAREAQIAGFTPIIFNWRGIGNMKLQGRPTFFGKNYTADLDTVVGFIQQKHPNNVKYIAGYSIGANILTNFLAKDENAKHIKAAVALGNPFNMAICRESIKSKGYIYRQYDKYMTLNFVKEVKNNLDFITTNKDLFNIDIQAALNAENLDQFDTGFTIKTLGYKDTHEYDQDVSSGNFLQNVKTPILFVSSFNDPVTIKDAIPYDKIKQNKYCMFVMTPSGGHLGWNSGQDAIKGESWAQKLTFQYFAAVHEGLLNQ